MGNEFNKWNKVIAGGLTALAGIFPGAGWASGAESIQVQFETSCAAEAKEITERPAAKGRE